MPDKAYITTKPIKDRKEDEEFVEIAPEQVLMEWKAREFIQYPRSKSWYIAVLIIAALLVVYAVITSNYLLAIIVVMLAVVVNTLTRKKPTELDVAITTKGVMVNSLLYTYDGDLSSFWILYNPPDLKTLNFSRLQKITPELTIQLESQNPLKVRELLLDHLEENVEKEEHLADRFSRKIGF